MVKVFTMKTVNNIMDSSYSKHSFDLSQGYGIEDQCMKEIFMIFTLKQKYQVDF